MNSRKPPPKTPFDNLVSSNNLDIMKLLIPFIPASSQPSIALYIKFQELQETMRIFKLFPNGIHSADLTEESEGSPDIISTLKPYLPEENLAMFENISNMLHMMEMMKQMQEMEQMSNANNESSSTSDHSMDVLKNLLSPEQQAMFNSMNQMFEESSSSTIPPMEQDDSASDF